MKAKFVLPYISIFLICAMQAQGQELVKTNDGFEIRLQQSFQVDAGGKLEVSDVNGDVQVESWSQNTVEVIETVKMNVYTKDEAQEIVQRIKSNYTQTGNTVRIRGIGDREEVESDYAIKVPEKFNLDISTSGGDLSIENVDGMIELASSGGDIALANVAGGTRAHTSGGDLDFKKISGNLEGSTSGGDINLEDIYGEATLSTSGGDIVLVHASQRVSLNTSGGDVHIEKVDGDVRASTSGGDVNVLDVKGKLSAATSGGDLKIENCSGAEISIQTSGGDIVMTNLSGNTRANTSGGDIFGRTLTGPVKTENSGGDIVLQNVQASVNAATTGGDVEVELTLKDFSIPHSISLYTNGGTLTLKIPEKLPATISADIQLSGSRYMTERNDIYSDFPLTKESADETNGHILRSNGKINGGGDPIILKTRNGDIYIKKLE
jgi:DUF4097 and DUF4098 domain-containing protein YvlB